MNFFRVFPSVIKMPVAKGRSCSLTRLRLSLPFTLRHWPDMSLLYSFISTSTHSQTLLMAARSCSVAFWSAAKVTIRKRHKTRAVVVPQSGMLPRDHGGSRLLYASCTQLWLAGLVSSGKNSATPRTGWEPREPSRGLRYVLLFELVARGG